MTTKLAAATKKMIGNRFVMSLPPGDRDIGGHRGVARSQKIDNEMRSSNMPIAATAGVPISGADVGEKTLGQAD